jgi:hypothetical protein
MTNTYKTTNCKLCGKEFTTTYLNKDLCNTCNENFRMRYETLPGNFWSEIFEHPRNIEVTPTKKSDGYRDIFEQIENIINSKNTQYTIDPIEILSINDLLTQIKIKAIRAQLTNEQNKTKLLDELIDVIVYCMLTMKKVNNEV